MDLLIGLQTLENLVNKARRRKCKSAKNLNSRQKCKVLLHNIKRKKKYLKYCNKMGRKAKQTSLFADSHCSSKTITSDKHFRYASLDFYNLTQIFV